ncbi:uncharacterized protein (TIGR02001 family) [Agrobacterium vitis]|nr:uncharacterized protein (TIGR02001 family) [Agrobacterium vitis]
MKQNKGNWKISQIKHAISSQRPKGGCRSRSSLYYLGTCIVSALYLCTPAQGLSADAVAVSSQPEAPPAVAPDFSVGYGVKFTSDYIFRGQTQSDGKPAVQGYVEGRLFDWFYGGIFLSSVSFPSTPWGLSDPALELDYFAGVRHTWGKFSADVGATYFTYPGQLAIGSLGGGLPSTDMNMWEFSFKPSYAVTDTLTIGGNIAYSPDYVGTGAPETYISANAKLVLPSLVDVKDLSWYTSGEFGRQRIGTTNLHSTFFSDIDMPDFNVWNAGIGFTYKSATLDFRYWGSNLNNGPTGKCVVATSITNACGDRVAVSLSFDL